MQEQPIDIGIAMVRLRIARNGNGQELESPKWYRRILERVLKAIRRDDEES
jgi:hypothetical protein